MIAALAPLRGGRPSVMRKRGPLPTRCLIWQGCLNSKGYAVRGTKESRYLVHRRAYEQHHDVRLPADVETHHLCEQKRCVNPAHVAALAPLDHQLAHREGPTLGERTIAALRSGGPARLSLLAVDLGTTEASLRTTVRRLGKAVQRVSPGLYAVRETA